MTPSMSLRGTAAMRYGIPIRDLNVPQGRCAGHRDCATCEIRDGIPRTNGWGYYASRGGSRMLVMERRSDQRIRINDSIEIIVLEIGDDKVRLGIDGAPGPHPPSEE
jgi:hypothetical protein